MPNELKQVLQDGEVLYAEYLHQLIDKTVDLANSKISEERLSAELTNISNTLKSYASTTAVTEAISKAINEHVATADSQYAKKIDLPVDENGIVPVEKGGTGAITVEEIRENLNVYSRDEVFHKDEICSPGTSELFGLFDDNNTNDILTLMGSHWWKRRVEDIGTVVDEEVNEIGSYSFYLPKDTVITLYYSNSYDIIDNNYVLKEPLSVVLTAGMSASDYSKVCDALTNSYSKDASKRNYFIINQTSGNCMYHAYSARYSGSNVYDFKILDYNSSETLKSRHHLKMMTEYKLVSSIYEVIGEYEYVHSTNRDTYPDSGRDDIFSYEYLGVPFENARGIRASALNSHWWKRRVEDIGTTIDEQTIKFSALGIESTNLSESIKPTVNFYYADAYTIDEITQKYVLLNPNPNPVRVQYNGSGNFSNATSKLSGKYFMIDTTTSRYMYFGGGNSSGNFAVSHRSYSSGTIKYVLENVTKYAVTFTNYSNIGEYEYLCSDDRNKYPDSGKHDIFTYYYLGVPFENARESTKIAIGSYVGTGKYGSANPNTITVDGTPQAIFIRPNGNNTAQFFNIRGNNSTNMGNSENVWTWGDDFISWYVVGTGSTAASDQKNSSGETYPYIIIYI